MGSVYVTGDVHGGLDIDKLSSGAFPENRMLLKDDYVIVLGDFGLVWDGSKEENYWRKWLNKKNFTTLFVDGNHENYDLLDSFPVEEWNGGKIQRIDKSIVHLMRGQIYELSGIKLFTFGGAASHDKQYRREHTSWWPREIPSESEFDEGLKNLSEQEWSVDYILSHTCPGRISRVIRPEYPIDPLNEYFDLIDSKVKYTHWYFGHFHTDRTVAINKTAVYKKVIKIR